MTTLLYKPKSGLSRDKMTRLMSASLYVPSIGMVFPLTSLAKLKSKTASRDAIVAQTVESAACRPMQTLVSHQKGGGTEELSLNHTVYQIQMTISGHHH